MEISSISEESLTVADMNRLKGNRLDCNLKLNTNRKDQEEAILRVIYHFYPQDVHQLKTMISKVSLI